MDRHTRLTLNLAAGATDQPYVDQVVQIGRKITDLIKPSQLVYRSNRIRGYDITSAFPWLSDEHPFIMLAFCMPGVIGAPGAVGSIRGQPAIQLTFSPVRGLDYDHMTDQQFREGLMLDRTMMSILHHEITHGMQDWVRQLKTTPYPDMSNRPTNEVQIQQWMATYHRHPQEVDAFFMQGLAKLWNTYTEWDEYGEPATPQEKLRIFGSSPAQLVQILRRGSLGRSWDKAPEDVRRRWIKRATQFWNHLFQSDTAK